MKRNITIAIIYFGAMVFILANLTISHCNVIEKKAFVNETAILEENSGMLKQETSFKEELTIENIKTIENEVEPEEETNSIEETKFEEESSKETQPEDPEAIEYLSLTGEYLSMDKSLYTIDEITLINTILEKINENVSNPDIHEETIPLYKIFSLEEYYKIASYFYIYYGITRAVDYTFDFVNASKEDGYLRITYDNIREFETELNQNKLKIDSILSNFTTGSEEHILKQISEYLQHNIVYTDGYYDLYYALNGKSVCNGYALAFNVMANRAGIKCDICIGKSSNGYHAWNRVTLSDGSYRFYDITFYDTTGNAKYLHSVTSLHGSYLINDYSECFLGY